MKRILSAVILMMLLLSGCAGVVGPSATRDEASIIGLTESGGVPSPFYLMTEAPTEPPTLPPTPQEINDGIFDAVTTAALSREKAEVKLDWINQYPELPTGCESVALTIALNRFGYELPKTEIADSYLIYGNDLITSYVGNPYGYGGAGIFPPGLAATAENFIRAKDETLSVYNTTGTALSDLYRFIEAGYPVVIWATQYMNYPRLESGREYEGVTYSWYDNEHCVVLYGYDLSDGTVSICDPIRGNVTYSAELTQNVFDTIGRFSIVLIKPI